jgi:hypothetical protein
MGLEMDTGAKASGLSIHEWVRRRGNAPQKARMHCCPAVVGKEKGENLARCQAILYLGPSMHENWSEEVAPDCLVATKRRDHGAMVL